MFVAELIFEAGKSSKNVLKKERKKSTNPSKLSQPENKKHEPYSRNNSTSSAPDRAGLGGLRVGKQPGNRGLRGGGSCERNF